MKHYKACNAMLAVAMAVSPMIAPALPEKGYSQGQERIWRMQEEKEIAKLQKNFAEYVAWEKDKKSLEEFAADPNAAPISFEEYYSALKAEYAKYGLELTITITGEGNGPVYTREYLEQEIERVREVKGSRDK